MIVAPEKIVMKIRKKKKKKNNKITSLQAISNALLTSQCAGDFKLIEGKTLYGFSLENLCKSFLGILQVQGISFGLRTPHGLG